MITHANVLAFVEWAVRYFGTRPSDRISGHPPLHFDLSTFDIFATLAAGAELHLVPGNLSLNPRALAAMIRDRELTQWFSVPSVLTYLAKFDVIAQDDFPALERLLWCGEVLPTPVLVHWMRRLPHVRFTNLYGPTEATIASSYYTVPRCPDDETASIPIGTPCAGEDLLVLDEELDPTAPGDIGDLYISGVGLSPGYWRDAEKTEAAFITCPDAPDAGASTGPVTWRGAPRTVSCTSSAGRTRRSRAGATGSSWVRSRRRWTPRHVRECAVVGVESGLRGNHHLLRLRATAGTKVTPVVIRSAIVRSLPNYMLPSRWLELEGLPKNSNGKTDRPALRKIFRDMP